MERILIIDDDAQVLDVLHLVLAREGYEVLKASNGNEGIKLHREDPVDLVITDLIMPEKEGIETIRELTAEFPEVKIIAMSGGGHVGADEYVHLAKKFGAQYTFTKPFTGEQILRAVKELLDNSPGAKNTLE